MLRLDFSEEREEIAAAVEEAEEWLACHPHDEEVRWARDAALLRRLPEHNPTGFREDYQ
jgi:hypothetical protein